MKTLPSGAILAAGIAWLSVGCTPTEKFLRADPASIEITSERMEKLSVTVEASSSWIFDSSARAEWLDLDYDGANPGLLSVSVGENESPRERTDSIIIVSGDGLELIIPFRQLAFDAVFDVSPQTLEPFGPSDDTQRVITVSTNLASGSGWDFLRLDGSEDWLTVVRGDEDAGKGSLTLSATPLRSLEERSETIVVRPANEEFAALASSIEVVQRGLDLLVDSESIIDKETSTVEVPSGGGEVILSVLSRALWSVSTDADTEKVSMNPVEGAADMGNGVAMIVTVAPNTGAGEYSFTLVFESAGKEYPYLFVQKGAEPEPEPETPEPEPQPEPELQPTSKE